MALKVELKPHKLDNTMAKTPDAVNGLLMQVWEKAVARAREQPKLCVAVAGPWRRILRV